MGIKGKNKSGAAIKKVILNLFFNQIFFLSSSLGP